MSNAIDMFAYFTAEVSDASNKRILFGVRTGSAVLICLEDGCSVEEKTN